MYHNTFIIHRRSFGDQTTKFLVCSENNCYCKSQKILEYYRRKTTEEFFGELITMHTIRFGLCLWIIHTNNTLSKKLN